MELVLENFCRYFFWYDFLFQHFDIKFCLHSNFMNPFLLPTLFWAAFLLSQLFSSCFPLSLMQRFLSFILHSVQKVHGCKHKPVQLFNSILKFSHLHISISTYFVYICTARLGLKLGNNCSRNDGQRERLPAVKLLLATNLIYITGQQIRHLTSRCT